MKPIIKKISLVLAILVSHAAWAGDQVCVTSLLEVSPNTMDTSQLQSLIESNLPHDFSADALDFKQGLTGLKDCLTGDYEVVTIIGHSEEVFPGKPVLVMQTPVSGKTIDIPVGSVFFENFLSSSGGPPEFTVSPTIRVLNFVACNGAQIVSSNSGLSALVQQQNWMVRVQPWDQAASTGSEKLTRLGGLTSLFIAEGLQSPEDLRSGKPVHCLVDARGLPMSLDAQCYFDQIEVRNPFWEPDERGIYWLEVGIDPDNSGKLKALSADRVDQDENGDIQWLKHIESPRFKLELK